MSPQERKKSIFDILTRDFTPLSLEVIDDSYQHIGHTGHQGAGHFTVKINASCFHGLPLITRHRMIYTALGALIGPEIHALSIHAKSPGE